MPDNATGFIQIEGDANFIENGRLPDQLSNISPALSQLCRDWKVPHLHAELTYRRNGPDTQLTLELMQEVHYIEMKENDGTSPQQPDIRQITSGE